VCAATESLKRCLSLTLRPITMQAGDLVSSSLDLLRKLLSAMLGPRED
jgi:hypothetical protein